MQKYYCVYIITNSRNTVLYTGVTGNLTGRIYPPSQSTTALAVGECDKSILCFHQRLRYGGQVGRMFAPTGRNIWHHGFTRGAPLS